MAIGDKYVVTLHSHESGVTANPFINVFAYQANNGLGTAADLAEVFETDLLAFLINVVSNITIFDQIEVINLDNTLDYDTRVVGSFGTRAGEYLPRFNAWEFEYIRADRAVHNGRKAFGLLAETDVVNGVADVGISGALATLEGSMAVPLIGSITGGNYGPKIYRRAGTYLVSGTPTVFPATFYPIEGVRYNRVSTQNTRKR